MNKGLTLREIARLAKVSTATVSRAINRVPTVDPVLARRIRKVIEKEGYFRRLKELTQKCVSYHVGAKER